MKKETKNIMNFLKRIAKKLDAKHLGEFTLLKIHAAASLTASGTLNLNNPEDKKAIKKILAIRPEIVKNIY